jgi:hypothetical protein
MANERKKHKILKHMHGFTKKYWAENPSDPYVENDPREGSLPSESLYKSLGYEDINLLCASLVEAKHLSIVDDEPFITLYKITTEGQIAYKEKFYLNQIWWRSEKFLRSWIPIAISIGALIVSIVALIKSY